MATQHDPLTETIIGCAFKVHNALGAGFLEKVYENALAIALRKQGLRVVQQESIRVYYEGEVVGDYCADLWVEDQVLVEVKAVEALNKAHEVQLVTSLVATRLDVGLLINFGQSVQVKRKYGKRQPQGDL